VKKSVQILGVRVDNVTMETTLTQIQAFLYEGGLHQVVTVNPEFVVLAQTDPEFRRIVNAAALNVPDGVGLLWAARQLGQPLRERVTGQEVVDRISALAAECGWRVFMLGAREGVAEKASAELSRRHPHLLIVGCYAGSPSCAQQAEIIERINASKADILFVAYGPPKQELWIARNALHLRVSLAMGVGGTFDTLAGIVPRAPLWVRRAGFEWMYRLVREPRRLRRQLAIPYFMWLVATRAARTAR
jgi:N-acetylglucosaminyldiphosphoundecaprenol N-acetyl-beta-D-mannosaminyltransferase